MTNVKSEQYAAKIIMAVAQLFEEESERPINDLMEGENLTHFMHALANIVPTRFYNQLTGEDKNSLEFNHIANRLCFQYMTIKPDQDHD